MINILIYRCFAEQKNKSHYNTEQSDIVTLDDRCFIQQIHMKCYEIKHFHGFLFKWHIWTYCLQYLVHKNGFLSYGCDKQCESILVVNVALCPTSGAVVYAHLLSLSGFHGDWWVMLHFNPDWNWNIRYWMSGLWPMGLCIRPSLLYFLVYGDILMEFEMRYCDKHVLGSHDGCTNVTQHALAMLTAIHQYPVNGYMLNKGIHPSSCMIRT